MYSKPTPFLVRAVSSLEKVFCKENFDGQPIESISAAKGETSAFQIACKSHLPVEISWEIHSDIAPFITVRRVGLVPCTYPAALGDPFVITTEAGLFPVTLLPGNTLMLSPGHWHSLWCDIAVSEDAKPGKYEVKIVLKSNETEFPFGETVSLYVEILPFVLPEQKLINICWFYADCLMTYYKVEAWSKKHWTILENYFRNMVRHGNNSILTPLWSLPLDTAEGGERPTCQLLDISFVRGKWKFDFTRLGRWIRLAKKCGFRYFEMSHAFTQWGAKHAPKIIVCENGKEVRKFGWETDAASEEYRDFLRSLMAALLPFLAKNGVTPENCFFHISDEPGPQVLENYKKASEILRPLLGDYPVIDALSHVDFFRNGLIRRPIPHTNAFEDFAEEKVEQRWAYYFGNWWDGVPNRFFGMPSARNRVIGVLMYVHQLDGMLNWGYNFWYSMMSRDQDLDPWSDSCAGGKFYGGNSFMVYPGRDGNPVDSIHFEVFTHALQDLRALQLLESLIGREETLKLVQDGLWHKLTFTRYPHEPEWLLDLRDRVNAEIVKALADNKETAHA